MEARVREAGGDAREVERRAQEHLLHRAPARVVVLTAAGGVAEAHAGEQRAADARVLRDQHVAVAQEDVADVALLHQEAEAVAGQRVGREVEVPLEEVDEPRGEARGLPEPLHAREERIPHLPGDRDHARVHVGSHRADRPLPVGARPDLVALGGGARVADRGGLAVPAGLDDEPLAGGEAAHVDAAAQRGHDRRRVAALDPGPAQRGLERLAPLQHDLDGLGGRRSRRDLGRLGHRGRDGLARGHGEADHPQGEQDGGGQEAVGAPHGLSARIPRVSRYAPYLVNRRALAITSGIRSWAGITPSEPPAQSRSVKRLTGSPPQ